MWTLDYFPDLESDFSAIHGIDDMYSLPSRKFFNFANRISAYQGVMRVLVEKEMEGTQMSAGAVQADRTVYEVPAGTSDLQMNFGEFMDVAEV